MAIKTEREIVCYVVVVIVECKMQYIDEAMAMRQKKQQLAQQPDRVLPTSFLHPMPSSTYVLLFVLILYLNCQYLTVIQHLVQILASSAKKIMQSSRVLCLRVKLITENFLVGDWRAKGHGRTY